MESVIMKATFLLSTCNFFLRARYEDLLYVWIYGCNASLYYTTLCNKLFFTTSFLLFGKIMIMLKAVSILWIFSFLHSKNNRICRIFVLWPKKKVSASQMVLARSLDDTGFNVLFTYFLCLFLWWRFLLPFCHFRFEPKSMTRTYLSSECGWPTIL